MPLPLRIAVAGATGALGRHVIPRLLERGHVVRALVRHPDAAARFRRVGVEPVAGDVLRPDTLPPLADGAEVLLHLATAVPRPGRPLDWQANDAVRRSGTRHLLQAAAGAGVRRIVVPSIALLYGEQGTRIADEDTPLAPNDVTRSAAEMEAMVSASEMEWVVLRAGLFYGPGTGREEDWFAQAHAGTLCLPERPHALMSLVHVADTARAIVWATESAATGATYNVVDDTPADAAELYRWIAALVGAAPPAGGGMHPLPSLAVSNARLVADSDWRPLHSSYRSGIAWPAGGGD